MKTYDINKELDRFIRRMETGKHLQKNGSRIRPSTIGCYLRLRKHLHLFTAEKQMQLRVTDLQSRSKRLWDKEKKYWSNFYREYSHYLSTKQGFADNTVGMHFKMIRTLLNYLKYERGIITGDIHLQLYKLYEEVNIVALSPEQLQFLIYDRNFEQSLGKDLQETKDIFLFGSAVGLRFSDLSRVNRSQLELHDQQWYLVNKSQKTGTITKVLLPGYALDILEKYPRRKQKLLPIPSLNEFNLRLKQLMEEAGWTYPVHVNRQKLGKPVYTNPEASQKRFCDLVSSHTMRRTAITNLLSLGVPEHFVRNVSGHAANSKEFYRYVKVAQHYQDNALKQAYEKLQVKPEK